MDKEIRTFNFECRAEQNEAHGTFITGTPIVFDQVTDLGFCNEVIARTALEGTDLKIFPISAATRSDLRPLVYAISDLLATLPPIEPFEEEDMFDIETDKGEMYNITVEGGVYVVTGRAMDYLINSTNFGNEESMNFFHRTLRRWGVIDALREKGANEGDTVSIGDMEFDFVE
jgi:GTP-binding protein